MPAEIIAAAAEVLKKSDVVVVSDDGKRVRRKSPLGDPEAVKKENDARSLYARPFPLSTDIDNVTEFFGTHGKVNSVLMRRHTKSKAFKGSVFVEFSDAATADKVLGSSASYEGAPLHFEKKVEYMERKKEERKNKVRIRKMARGSGRLLLLPAPCVASSKLPNPGLPLRLVYFTCWASPAFMLLSGNWGGVCPTHLLHPPVLQQPS